VKNSTKEQKEKNKKVIQKEKKKLTKKEH